MIDQVTIADLRHALVGDGSLLNIIFDADTALYRRTLEYIDANFVVLSIDAAGAEGTLDPIFCMRHIENGAHPATLTFDVGGVEMRMYFDDPIEIELDFVPDLVTAKNLVPFLSALHQLARSMSTSLTLYEDNASQRRSYPVLVVRHDRPTVTAVVD